MVVTAHTVPWLEGDVNQPWAAGPTGPFAFRSAVRPRHVACQRGPLRQWNL